MPQWCTESTGLSRIQTDENRVGKPKKLYG
jgi:hypothetical protein